MLSIKVADKFSRVPVSQTSDTLMSGINMGSCELNSICHMRNWTAYVVGAI